MKHTKGEWKVLRQIQGDIITGIGVEESDNYYRVLFNNILPDTDEEYDNERLEQEANAKLIAAAPDLLEACIAVVKWADDLGYYNDYTIVREAIKKATD